MLAFQSSTTGRAFQIEYPSITLHAISRGESGPFVYCQLDDSPEVAADGGDEDVLPMRELSLTPQPSDSRASPTHISSTPRLTLTLVDPIFEALSVCASLHPDPQGSDEDEDGFIDLENSGDFEVFTGTEGEELSEVGRVRSDFANDNRYQPY